MPVFIDCLQKISFGYFTYYDNKYFANHSTFYRIILILLHTNVCMCMYVFCLRQRISRILSIRNLSVIKQEYSLIKLLTAATSTFVQHCIVVVDLMKTLLLATYWTHELSMVTIMVSTGIANWHWRRIIVVVRTWWMRWWYIPIRMIWIHCYGGGQLDGFFLKIYSTQ